VGHVGDGPAIAIVESTKEWPNTGTLVADSQKIPKHKLGLWGIAYRKTPGGKRGLEGHCACGDRSLDLGFRLDSSARSKGCDCLSMETAPGSSHMLREMIREPQQKIPTRALSRFCHTRRQVCLSRAFHRNLQRENEAARTPSMGIESRTPWMSFAGRGARNRHPALPHRLFQQAL